MCVAVPEFGLSLSFFEFCIFFFFIILLGFCFTMNSFSFVVVEFILPCVLFFSIDCFLFAESFLLITVSGMCLVVEVHQQAVEGPFSTLNMDMYSGSLILFIVNLAYFPCENSGVF